MTHKIKKELVKRGLFKHIYILAFVVVVFFMGINFIFIKNTNRELPPLWSASIRYLSASIILLYIARIKNINLLNTKNFKVAVLYGVIAYGANSGLLYYALVKTSSIIASIIFSSIPLSTLIFACLFKIEKLTLKGIISSILVITGIILISYQQIRIDVSIIPIISLLIASIFAAGSSIIIKKNPSIHPISLNAISMASGGIILLGLSMLTKEQILIPIQLVTWLSLTWLIISSVIMFSLFIWLIKNWSAVKTSYVSVLAPIATIAAGHFLLDERLTPLIITGGLIVSAGSLIGIRLRT